MTDLLSIGKILNFHGLKGEAKVGYSLGKENQLKSLRKVLVEKDGELKPLQIAQVRFHKKAAIIKNGPRDHSIPNKKPANLKRP